VVLHVEQHQAAVSKRVDGAQDERRHQGGEEGAPQRLEGEVVAHLDQRERERENILQTLFRFSVIFSLLFH